eukprot:sb/3473381/
MISSKFQIRARRLKRAALSQLKSDILKLSPPFCREASYLRVTAPTCSHFLAEKPDITGKRIILGVRKTLVGLQGLQVPQKLLKSYSNPAYTDIRHAGYQLPVLPKNPPSGLANAAKVRFKRLDLRFLEIGVLRVVFTKRDPEFPGISGQVV